MTNYSKKPKKRRNKNKPLSLAKQLKYDSDCKITFKEVDIYYSNNSSTVIPFIFTFDLNKLVGATTWISHYDQYRIDRVQVIFTPVQTEIITKDVRESQSGNTVNCTPLLTYCTDYDGDELGSLSYASVKARHNSKVVKANKGFSIMIKPNTLTPVYRDGSTWAYQRTKGKAWIDTGYPNVPHYGMIGAMEFASPSTVFTYNVSKKYWITLHGRKS